MSGRGAGLFDIGNAVALFAASNLAFFTLVFYYCARRMDAFKCAKDETVQSLKDELGQYSQLIEQLPDLMLRVGGDVTCLQRRKSDAGELGFQSHQLIRTRFDETLFGGSVKEALVELLSALDSGKCACIEFSSNITGQGAEPRNLETCITPWGKVKPFFLSERSLRDVAIRKLLGKANLSIGSESRNSTNA